MHLLALFHNWLKEVKKFASDHTTGRLENLDSNLDILTSGQCSYSLPDAYCLHLNSEESRLKSLNHIEQ